MQPFWQVLCVGSTLPGGELHGFQFYRFCSDTSAFLFFFLFFLSFFFFSPVSPPIY